MSNSHFNNDQNDEEDTQSKNSDPLSDEDLFESDEEPDENMKVDEAQNSLPKSLKPEERKVLASARRQFLYSNDNKESPSPNNDANEKDSDNENDFGMG